MSEPAVDFMARKYGPNGSQMPKPVQGIPLMPKVGTPEWSALIVPPDPDPGVEALDAEGNIITPPTAPAPAPPKGDARIVVSFGRNFNETGEVIVGLERAPDWDIEVTVRTNLDALRTVLPLFKALARLKDLTGELTPTIIARSVVAPVDATQTAPPPKRRRAPKTTPLDEAADVAAD